MVATKMVPNKRRGGFNNGMPIVRPRFKPGGPKPLHVQNSGVLFNANQLDDNPGFVDFNDDVQIPSASTTSGTVAATNTTSGTNTNGTSKGPTRKVNSNQKRRGMRRNPQGMGFWGPPMPPMPPMFPMGGGRRNGPLPPPPPHFRAPPMGMRGIRGGPMMPPPLPNGRFGGPPMGPGPMSMMPRPMPPMPPMRGPMMNPMGRMMPPPMGIPPMRRNPNGKLPPGRMGKGPKGAVQRVPPTNGKIAKTIGKKIKPKVPAKPKEDYPLDKPWVTEEIKAEHQKKVDLAERLKGKKDDALFAQFKEQRDKFVKMYDAARLEFIGKHPEQDVEKILTESGEANKAKVNNESQISNDAVSTDTPAATKSSTTTSATASSAAGAAKSAASSA